MLCSVTSSIANVGLLPFTDDALAASVGCTAAELNAEPIDQLAVDVVFDALAESQSGIVGREECDARRAAFTAADGAFDAAAFADGLSARGARLPSRTPFIQAYRISSLPLSPTSSTRLALPQPLLMTS